MLVVLAKLGSPEMVGQFTLGLAVTAPVIMFTNLQLRTVQATDAKEQYVFGDYLGLRLIGTGSALLIIGTVTVSSHYRLETLLVILIIGFAKAFESISDIFYGLLQRHEQMDRIAISLIIKGLLSLLLLGIGVYLTKGILGGVIGLAMAWAIVLVGYDIRNGAIILSNFHQETDRQSVHLNAHLPLSDGLRPRWHLVTMSKLARVALPLGFIMMLISLNVNIPRYFIQTYLGERKLGIFAAISYAMVLGNMVVGALGDSATPRLSNYYISGEKVFFRTLLVKLTGIGALMGGVAVCVALVGGRQLLTLLYRAEYAEYADLFVLLMLAAGVGYVSSFLGYVITAVGYFRVQVPLFVLISVVSSLTCFWLVPIYGLLGAAIALVLAAIVQVSFSIWIVLYALQKIDKYVYK